MPGAALGFLYAGYSFAALSFGGFVTGALVAGSAGFSARLHPKRREASLAAFYLLSLAVGVMIVSVRGSNVDLMHVLFGTVLAVDMRGLLFIATVSSVTLLVLAVIYRPLAVDSFDPTFLRSVGTGSGVFRGIFLAAVVLNLVASFQAFGTLLAVGPMLLPAAAALCWTERMWSDHRAQCRGSEWPPTTPDCSLVLCQSAVRPAIVFASGIIYGISLIGAGRTRLRGSTAIEEDRR
jgi:zinc/manganese transport system permease protein